MLAETAGYVVQGRLIQERGRPAAATLLGKGKVRDAARMVRERDVRQVILDDDLSPQQVGNLEAVLKVPVGDRAGLILDIFALRARTREARTQVELASLRYLLPRLARRWTHLSRQVGGIGVRGGVGETQIELDRRIIRRRIARLERDLVQIRRQRRTRRKGRQGVFSVALVGYTNSGKTTLFNRLTRADARVEDRLFSTLDARRRRLACHDGSSIVVTDTVGFIRKLPHHLVAAFRSTLEEAADAKLLVQVVDLVDPGWEEKMRTARKVLHELGLEKKPCLLVFNKLDRLRDSSLRRRVLRRYPEAIFISARTAVGVKDLRTRMAAVLRRDETTWDIEIEAGDGAALATLSRNGRILRVQREDGRRLKVRYRTDRVGAGRIRNQMGQIPTPAHA